MSTKSISYKIQTNICNFAKSRTHNPIIEHNIPEEYIVTNLKTNYVDDCYSTNCFWNNDYLYINEDQFNMISDKLIYPTEIWSSKGYIGSFIWRVTYDNKTFDILCHANKRTFKDKEFICIIPVNYVTSINAHHCSYTKDKYPNRKVKIFFSLEEREKDKADKELKSKNKKLNKLNAQKKLNELNPEFSFSTPKLKIVDIVKHTDWIKDAKIGDIICGKMKIISDKNGVKVGCLYGVSTCSNYIDIYVNDEYYRSISPLSFQDLFLNNYQVEEIK